MYRSITRSIEVTAEPYFLADQSDPSQNKFVWAYKINIANLGLETVQLLTRHWVITDANGISRDVRGPGVIGAQPRLGPQDRFSYSSGCPLTSASGLMVGTYGMITDAGEHFEINIPAFSLDSPFDKHTVN